MALVLKTAGCSKCRWSSRGCGKCDPDTPRVPRGISAARKKAREAATKSKVTAKRPRCRPPGTKNNNNNNNNKKLAVVKTQATKKTRIVRKNQKHLWCRKTTSTKDTSTGCSKCRCSKNRWHVRSSSKTTKRSEEEHGFVSSLIVSRRPTRRRRRRQVIRTYERRKNPVGRPTKHRAVRTELGCSKCQYTACSNVEASWL